MEFHPGTGVWPPLRVANFVLSTLNILKILDKSLALLGVTTQAGSCQFVCDLEIVLANSLGEIPSSTRATKQTGHTKGSGKEEYSIQSFPRMSDFQGIVLGGSNR